MYVNIQNTKNQYEVGDVIRTKLKYRIIAKNDKDKYELIDLNGEVVLYDYDSIDELLADLTITEHYKSNELELRLRLRSE